MATGTTPASATPRWVKVAVTLWLAAVFVGLGLVWRHKAAAGTPASAPPTWPTASVVPRLPGRPTLVMFAHPHCPCTAASLEELAQVMTHAAGRVDAWILFVRPDGTGMDWENTSTYRRAERIDGVKVRRDVAGSEAERFGSWVSGQVMLYDPAGDLRFSGGITGSRGHEGDNVGRQLLISLIESQSADAARSDVYGCDLFDRSRGQGRAP